MATTSASFAHAQKDYKIWKVIGASSAGTVIEWYDFYLFGALATTLSPKFYPPGNETFALIAYLATFAIGFVVRPFGAAFFGRIGDMVGRKYTFLLTLIIMGVATVAIGVLPSYEVAGWFTPIVLILIRILQGLALGGEYGGAAIYIAEHVPDERRGFYTSFIQITATFGLFMALMVILAFQEFMSEEAFNDYGYRIPFLLSAVLVGVSLYIRVKMKESPIFSALKSQGKTSLQPLKETFTNKGNFRAMSRSLFGATAGQGVVWYTGQFYALFFLQSILFVDKKTASIIVAIALVLGMPLFVVFGRLSDRIGRKRIMMAGCLLAVISYLPIYYGMQQAAGNDVVSVNSTTTSGGAEVKLIPRTEGEAGQPDQPLITADDEEIRAPNPNEPLLVLLVFIQMIWVTMVYAPIAAYLVEAFPAKVRYTSMSLPYHIGNGVFGGLLPLIGLSVAAWTHNIYAGLAYPMIVAGITFVVGMKYLPETKDVRIWDELEAQRAEKEPTPAGAG